MLGREEALATGRGVIAYDVMHVDVHGIQLTPEDDVGVREGAVDNDDVALRLLHERAHWRDADPAGDEEELFPPARPLGEDSERAFGDYSRADRNRAEPGGVIAQRLCSDA